MRAANIDYIGKFMGQQPQKRVITEVDIDSNLIKDGDLILARRMDGMDPFYMVSSGSQASHAAVALRDEKGEVYVLEAQSAFYFKNGESGVQKTRYVDWIEHARDADFDVVWVALKDDKRKEFNSTLAWEFYKDTEGSPYSHRAQFFSVIDTLEDNYFAPLSAELVPFMIRYMQDLYPTTFDLIFKEALNKRLGIHDPDTFYHTFEDLMVQAVIQNKTSIEKLMTLPEEDTWSYANA